MGLNWEKIKNFVHELPDINLLESSKNHNESQSTLYGDQLFKAITSPRKVIYSAMMEGNPWRKDVYHIHNIEPDQYTYIIRNADKLDEIRRTIPRNLASLYVYGNELNQFKELPYNLASLGTNYTSYLKSIGKDPSKIKTYKGNISVPVILPDLITEDQLAQFINSPQNKNYGNTQTMANTDLRKHPETDDVAGFLQQLTYINGKPYVVNSDYWDFKPDDYVNAGYGTNTYFSNDPNIDVFSDEYKKAEEQFQNKSKDRTYVQAYLLDKLGHPFILKDFQPVQFTDVDTFYGPIEDPREISDLEKAVLNSAGWLDPVIVTAKRKKKKR